MKIGIFAVMFKKLSEYFIPISLFFNMFRADLSDKNCSLVRVLLIKLIVLVKFVESINCSR